MSASPSPRPPSVIVTRLRAAGCVFAEDEARLLISAARTPADLAAMVDRRAAGMPIEYVVGWAEFCGLRIAVDPGVFVPRHRTEFLVRQAADLARRAAAAAGRGAASAGRVAAAGRGAASPGRVAAADGQVAAVGQAAAEGQVAAVGQAAGPAGEDPARPGVVVVDLCCGSGAVGAALVAALDQAELHAVDIDAAAVACARRNVAAAGGQVYQGDLYEPLPARLRGRVGILVANVPYVPTDAIGLLPSEARMHEPRIALDGGADGLDVMRRVTAAAREWLAPGGHLLIETSERQAPQAVETVARNGLIPQLARSDELNATIVIGTRPGPGVPCP
jgi:release factor glutamine methyltransferase